MERQARTTSQATVCRSDSVQGVPILIRDMDLYLLPRKAGVTELSPQFFRQCWQVSALCIGVAAQHYVPTTRYGR